MIFDYYLSIDFNSSDSCGLDHPRFKDEPMYKDIIGTEVSFHLGNGYVSCLHRRNYKDSYAEINGIKLWVFGYVFTNNNFTAKIYGKPRKFDAEDILKLYLNDKDAFVHYLKGSYVLTFFNEKAMEAKVITDRLNVLPLYFAFDKGKLVISSNVAMILKSSWVSCEIDSLAMTMQTLFDYMLGEYYFVKGVRRFENARIYSFDNQGLRKKIYWDVSELYCKQLLPKRQSLDMLAEQLKENVNLYSSDVERILVSLTGGFDGRTNVAMLDKDKNDFLCYSYGMHGSTQIQIPQEISKKMGINYKPIYLDHEFLENYYNDTIGASYFSNGSAPVGFNNIAYAFKKLSGYSDTILTGLFGSEILRPMYNSGIQINDQSYAIFLNSNYAAGIENAFNHASAFNYFSHDFQRDTKFELGAYLTKNFFTKYKDYDSIMRFFFFFIQEGIRKYFSQEISIERMYVSTRFPYFDTDLVDLVYQTTWAGMYNGFLKSSKFKRRKGQLLYAHIMKKYKPDLGEFVLDRGYTPNDLLLMYPINYLTIGFGVFKEKRHIRKAGGNDTFRTETWSIPALNQIFSEKTSITEFVFNDVLQNLFKTDGYLENFLTFRHMASIYAFLQKTIGQK